MIEDPVTVLLNRAAVLLQELAEPGWERIAAGVIDAVRGAPRGGWPCAQRIPAIPGERARSRSPIWCCVARWPGPSGWIRCAFRSLIDIAVESTEVKRIRIELTVRYGSELRAVAEQVRTVAAAVVADLWVTSMREGSSTSWSPTSSTRTRSPTPDLLPTTM